MTIKFKIILNASIVLIVIGAVAVTSFIGMRLIRNKLTYLTEQTTPFQMRTVEFQRALQGATADLIKVVAAKNGQDYAIARSEAGKSLEDVQKSQEILEKLSGERLEASIELRGIADELFTIMTAKLSAEQQAVNERSLILQWTSKVNLRLKELDSKVKNLQQTSSVAYAGANEEADKTSKKLMSIETLKGSLKEIQYLIGEIQRAQNKKQIVDRFNSAMRLILQNGNVRNNKQIGSDVNILQAKMESLFKAQSDGGDIKRIETQFKEANEAQSKVVETIEDEVDRSQQSSFLITNKLPGYIKKANTAVIVLSNNSDLMSLGISVEGLSSRLFLAKDEKELDGIAAEIDQQYTKISRVEKTVEALLKSARADRELKTLREAASALTNIREKVLVKGGIVDALRQKMLLDTKAEQGAAKLREIVRKQSEKGKQTVSTAQVDQEKAIATVNTTIRFSTTLILLIALGAALLGAVVGTWIYRSIATPMGLLISVTDKVAAGDLAVNLSSCSDDEVGKVQASVAKMVTSFREMVGKIGLVTVSLASSSEEMSATAGTLEEGAAAQRLRVESTVTGITEMSNTTMEVARNTNETAQTADIMKQLAEEGKASMLSTVRDLQHFAESFKETADKVEHLGEQSTQINDIVALIRDIADQTNLLALNAAIEAARAGDQGRGFAVVADSVRQLANRTAGATADITHTVAEMQRGVTQSVTRMSEERRSVDTILGRVNATLEMIDRIVQYVEKVDDMVRLVAVAAEQQSATSNELSVNVEEIAMITRQFSGSCSSISQSSDELSRLAGELNQMVAWFRV